MYFRKWQYVELMRKKNPLDMDVCPMGYDSCVDGCEEYDEEW